MTEDLGGRIVVFAGPSAPPELRPPDPVFAWRGPAIAGDMLALEDQRPAAVVLIDGLFDLYPAVRHKELLELMARGVPLFGGASMGALRAAELHRYGMIGVGRIFEAYAGGRLVGDDEVAVLHGPAEWGWPPLTEALVNVRASLVRAVRAGAADASQARWALRVASNIFYQDRTWPALRETLATCGALRLADWLWRHRVDLKRADALACLGRARAFERPDRERRALPPATIFTGYLAEQVSAGLRRSPAFPEPP